MLCDSYYHVSDCSYSAVDILVFGLILSVCQLSKYAKSVTVKCLQTHVTFPFCSLQESAHIHNLNTKLHACVGSLSHLINDICTSVLCFVSVGRDPRHCSMTSSHMFQCCCQMASNTRQCRLSAVYSRLLLVKFSFRLSNHFHIL